MAKLPETGPSLLRHLRQQQRQMIREADASPFSRSGSGVTAVDEVTYEGVLKVLGQMVVDGTLTVNGPMAVSGTLGVTGDAALDGDTTVGGTLTSADFDGDLAAGDAGTSGWAMNAARVAIGELFLRPGSVGNDTLTSPVEVGDFDHSETGFDPVTGAGGWPTVSSVTLTVPDGFTQGVITAVAYAAIRNTTPSTSTQIHCRALVAGVGGPVDDERSEPGVRSTTLSVFSTRVTGLAGGGTFDVAVQAYGGADFAADANNVATISGTVLWLR